MLIAESLVMAPYVTGQTIIYLPCVFFFLLLLSFFFPRLISAVADWMSTILPHMVCEFRMQVWNVPHAARWKYRTQKIAKNLNLGTTTQFCRAIFSELRHISTIGKKLVKEQYLLHTSW